MRRIFSISLLACALAAPSSGQSSAGAVPVAPAAGAPTAAAGKVGPVVKSVTLEVGKRSIRQYETENPKAVIIFGSGDGGWSYFEEKICLYLQKHGYWVVGLDFHDYASADYTLEKLKKDFTAISKAARTDAKGPDLPLIWGGWSMGAEQAVPAAAELKETFPVRGLLLVAPGERGRYGLHWQDRMGIAPKGVNTFGVVDFAEKLGKIKVAQFHPGLDLLDSISWLDKLKAPHKLWTLPRSLHNFDGASDAFLKQIKEGMDYLLAAEEAERAVPAAPDVVVPVVPVPPPAAGVEAAPPGK